MLHSDEQLLENRIQALQHRRDELSQKVTALKIRAAAEADRYQRNVTAIRKQAFFFPRLPSPQQLSKVDRFRREAFRQAYVVGFVFSLLVGLLAIAARSR
jgi:hypothetical protein